MPDLSPDRYPDVDRHDEGAPVRRVLVGGTASGKKAVAAALHRRHGLTLLSMDSMKVYRGMDIGTDKPPPEAVAELGWRLLDLAGHDESFSSARWVEAAVEVAEAASAPLLFAGGTPLYLRLLLRGLFPGPPADPELRAELEALWEREGEAPLRAELRAVDPVLGERLLPGDRKRIVRALEVHRSTGRALSDWQREETRPPLAGRFEVVALRHPPEHHERRIRARVERMFDDGLTEEVAALQARAPFGPEAGRAIGYEETRAMLAGTMDEAAAKERIAVRTRQLVRKQRMFLASFPEIRWIDVEPGREVSDLADEVARALGLG